MPDPEIAVLGRGIAGLTIAWELARRGHPPVVIGGARPAASDMAAGMLAPGPEMDLNPGIALLAAESHRTYPDFIAALAEDTERDPGYRRSGLLRLAFSDDEAVALRDGVGQYEAAGLPTHWLTAKKCVAAEPRIDGDAVRGGLLSLDEGQVQPASLMAALEQACRQRGVRFVAGEVAGVHQSGTGVDSTLADGSVLSAASVVLALGGWTALLPGLEYLLRPLRGELLLFPGGAGPRRILYWGHNYLVSKPDGSVILGATMEDAGFSLRPSAAAQDLLRLLPRLSPALVGAAAEIRVGLRPAAADGLPVIGQLPELPAVYVFGGHLRNGFLLAPLTARLAAAEVLDGASQPLLARLRPARLARATVRASE